mmetsp:Transcript_13334/g.36848  ORF Transcript_13334/g.36848 Transcript_13334/m.36848 type:complete len:306 (+) Transcript_13334:143-1060(+)
MITDHLLVSISAFASPTLSLSIVLFALQMLGTWCLWFGWYGFNGGSALVTDSVVRDKLAALAGVNTTLSGGMAGIVALFVNLYWVERTTGEPVFDLRCAMNGSLGGLVAITAGCGVVEPWASIVIGAIAGLVYLLSSALLIRIRLDDAVDGIPVHMFNGMWGMVANGFFASPTRLKMTYNFDVKHAGWFYSLRDGNANAHLLAAQVVGVLFILVWVMVIMLPFFVWLDWQGLFRSDPLEELVGLDTSYHGGVILHAQENVNPEYISQFKLQRNNLRNRRRNLDASDRSDHPAPSISNGDMEEAKL